MEKSRFERAICFAVNAHSGMTRKGGGTPYIVHPMEAAVIASYLTSDEDVLCAAVLHDTVEDTSVTAEDLREEFGERIASLVLFDSENKREGLPAADTWELRKRETLDALSSSGREEQILVLADKLSNMRSIYRSYLEKGDALWLAFNQKDKNRQEWYYRSIAEKLTLLRDSSAYREYLSLLDLVF